MKKMHNSDHEWLEGTVFIGREKDGRIFISFYDDPECKYFAGVLHLNVDGTVDGAEELAQKLIDLKASFERGGVN